MYLIYSEHHFIALFSIEKAFTQELTSHRRKDILISLYLYILSTQTSIFKTYLHSIIKHNFTWESHTAVLPTLLKHYNRTCCFYASKINVL